MLAWQFVTFWTIVFTERPFTPKKLVSPVLSRASSAEKDFGVKLGFGVIMSVTGSLV